MWINEFKEFYWNNSFFFFFLWAWKQNHRHSSCDYHLLRKAGVTEGWSLFLLLMEACLWAKTAGEEMARLNFIKPQIWTGRGGHCPKSYGDSAKQWLGSCSTRGAGGSALWSHYGQVAQRDSSLWQPVVGWRGAAGGARDWQLGQEEGILQYNCRENSVERQQRFSKLRYKPGLSTRGTSVSVLQSCPKQ